MIFPGPRIFAKKFGEPRCETLAYPNVLEGCTRYCSTGKGLSTRVVPTRDGSMDVLNSILLGLSEALELRRPRQGKAYLPYITDTTSALPCLALPCLEAAGRPDERTPVGTSTRVESKPWTPSARSGTNCSAPPRVKAHRTLAADLAASPPQCWIECTRGLTSRPAATAMPARPRRTQALMSSSRRGCRQWQWRIRCLHPLHRRYRCHWRWPPPPYQHCEPTRASPPTASTLSKPSRGSSRTPIEAS